MRRDDATADDYFTSGPLAQASASALSRMELLYYRCGVLQLQLFRSRRAHVRLMGLIYRT